MTKPAITKPAITTPAITPKDIERAIRILRGQRVLVDDELARLYGVETKNLNKAIKRNAARFPADFMFQMTDEEAAALRFQNGTSKVRGGRRYLPYVFTQEGVAMLSSILSSPRAIAVNIEIMRTFVRMREVLAANTEVMKRLGLLEAEVVKQGAVLGQHKTETTQALKVVFEALKQMAQQQATPEPVKPPVGFKLK